MPGTAPAGKAMEPPCNSQAYHCTSVQLLTSLLSSRNRAQGLEQLSGSEEFQLQGALLQKPDQSEIPVEIRQAARFLIMTTSTSP